MRLYFAHVIFFTYYTILFLQKNMKLILGWKRRGRLQGVHSGSQPVQRQRRQENKAQICLQVRLTLIHNFK